MQPVFQSSFLQALGFAIANSLWQTAILWLVYMSVNSLFALSAAAKYRLAVAAQLISFSLFLTTLQLFLTQFSNTGSLTIGTQPIRISPNTEQLRWLIKGLANAELLLPYVSMAYLVIMLVLCLRWVLGYRQTQQIRRKGLSKIPVEWRLFVNRISDQLAIKKEIRLFLSASISTPLTIGFLKPVILIPMASLNHLSADQMEAV
ncbi:MAG: M56 family metallopeptidase, partial [Sediminibacterium sp.]|nr:M56 family metallopeptidase [Sediminibacterium sp.]